MTCIFHIDGQHVRDWTETRPDMPVPGDVVVHYGRLYSVTSSARWLPGGNTSFVALAELAELTEAPAHQLA
jgi:hypothetical protein